MKVSASIAAISLIGLSSADCPNGYGTLASDNTIVPIGVCIASNDGNGNKAVTYSCGGTGEPQKTLYTDYNCITDDGNGLQDATADFEDGQGGVNFDCQSDASCDFYHIHEYSLTQADTCQNLNDADTAGKEISSVFFFSQVTSGVVNMCNQVSADQYAKGTIADGMCTAPTTGVFYTLVSYSDSQCTSQTAAVNEEHTLNAPNTDTADVYDDGNGNAVYKCRYFVECSADTIITSAPTTAPTESPTESPTDAPSAAPTESPTDAPSAAPTTAPSASPTAAPVATESPSTAPSAAPTASPNAITAAPTSAPTDATSTTSAPTTASSSSSAQVYPSIFGLLLAFYYAIIA